MKNRDGTMMISEFMPLLRGPVRPPLTIQTGSWRRGLTSRDGQGHPLGGPPPNGKVSGPLVIVCSPPATSVVREAVRRAGIDPGVVDECIMGNVVSAGLGQAPARQAALRGGSPTTFPRSPSTRSAGPVSRR